MVHRENEMTYRSHLILIAFVTVVLASPAHAYLDGGTGSMLVQLLLGGFAGVTVLAKMYWHRLRAVFGGSTGGVPHSEAHDGRE